MKAIKHKELESWVEETAKLAAPDQVYWVDGTPAEKDRLTKRAIARGFIIPLDQEKYPGCYYSRACQEAMRKARHFFPKRALPP